TEFSPCLLLKALDIDLRPIVHPRPSLHRPALMAAASSEVAQVRAGASDGFDLAIVF
ncbi:hypothetical protein P7K49_003233, partial [Saguinus oedipus]